MKVRPSTLFACLTLLILTGSAFAQERGPNVAAQREAMQKLAFLTGRWVGEAAVVRGPGSALKIEQTEEVQFKLDGLVLQFEGTGRNAEGKVVFSALATVAYDEATQTYRFRSYSGGRYLDTEIKVGDHTFEWGYTAGPLTVTNAMHLDAAGNWVETTDAKFGDNPARRSFDMTVKKQP